MNRRHALVATVALLTGCSTPEPVPSPTAAPTLGHVASVDDLQAAYVDAGGTCSGELENRGVVKAAADSAWCPGGSIVLSTYLDHEDAKASAQGLLDIGGRVGVTVIVGENWLVNAGGEEQSKVQGIADRLGGEVTTVEASP